MKRPNITPGKWEVQDSYTALFYNDPREETVWEVNGREWGNSPAYATSEAHAYFIAAAPDMAKALERLLACPDLNLGNLEDETCEAMAEAKAALTKAGYESP